MIQIDGPGRRVYIKFHNNEQAQATLHATTGQLEYQHENGESYTVHIKLAGMGTKHIRIANLPPEVPNNLIREALASRGEIIEIIEESWPKVYRYSVSNGIRIAITRLKKHIPSNMSIAGNKVLISYENQPPTCYGCKSVGHQNQECPKHRTINGPQNAQSHPTWADMVTQRATNPPDQPSTNKHATEYPTTSDNTVTDIPKKKSHN
jgi:hypothetical protein